MAERKDKELTNLNKQLSDSDTLDDEPINPKLKTSVEKRHYGTIPGLVLATQAALSHTCTQANPTVECGPSHTKTIKKSKLLRSLHRLISKRNKSKWFVMTLHHHM